MVEPHVVNVFHIAYTWRWMLQKEGRCMDKRRIGIGIALAGTVAATTSFADDYAFEIGAAYGRDQFNWSSNAIVSGSPVWPDGSIISAADSDTDSLDVTGTWYFAGLSDDDGPRARAMFVDRASTLSVAYSRSEASNSLVVASDIPNVPSLDYQDNTSGDSFGAFGRYVNRSGGWFGQAGVVTTDSTFDGDATAWSLGVGKYVLDTTALSLDIGHVERENDGTDIATLGFTHLGSVGESWQYAVDLGYEYRDSEILGELHDWQVGVSFYPTRDFEFGVAFSDDESRNPFPKKSVEGFVSWFITPKVELGARYRVDDLDVQPSFTGGGIDATDDADQDRFGIRLNLRF